MNKADVAAKACGAVGVTVVGLSVHDRAKNRAQNYNKKRNAEAIGQLVKNNQADPAASKIGQGIRNLWIKERAETKIFDGYNLGTGYLRGVFNAFSTMLIPATCSAMALLGKGVVNKVGLVGLGLYGLNFLVTKVLLPLKKDSFSSII